MERRVVAASQGRDYGRLVNDDAWIVSQMRSSRMGSSLYVLILKKTTGAMLHRCGAYHRASDAKVRTNSPDR